MEQRRAVQRAEMIIGHTKLLLNSAALVIHSPIWGWQSRSQRKIQESRPTKPHIYKNSHWERNNTPVLAPKRAEIVIGVLNLFFLFPVGGVR